MSIWGQVLKYNIYFHLWNDLIPYEVEIGNATDPHL